ncbi:NUMOD4 motif-containing HNH endonuclease [Pseudomonas syringae]|uniref:NUMOD4 motif-containing HNH endonuclease n=1 Tax=Pseudomonas syringae TaxID=317 RepID=UPI0013624319|nr:NUMOD4 motif-containing HNH endonuclease [Pseudomonas syringae]
MIEIWAESKTLAGRYSVSSQGRVKRIAHNATNSAGITKFFKERLVERAKSKDYPRIILKVEGKAKAYLIHRLVAEVFVPNPEGLPCINHKDGDKSNPSPENLEWCTHQQNMQHAMDSGLNSCKTPVVSNRKGVGHWFPSMESAVLHTGVSKPCICAAAKKRQRTAGGMSWDYTDPIVAHFARHGVVFSDLIDEVAA